MNITFPSQQKSMTISEGVEAFLFHCQYEKNLNIKTLVAYQTDLTQFTGYLQQAKIPEPLMELNKHMLKQYIQSLYIYKPKTIKRKVASLKAMLNFIEFENDHFINPFRKIRMKYKENYTLPCVMTMQEIKKIMHTVYEKKYTYQQTGGYGFKAVVRDIAVIELLFATGIRVAELCNLSPANIDLKNGKIKVLGKGSKERIIQVCQSEVLIALKEYYRLFTPLIKKQSFFFINRLGAPLSPQSVRLMIREYTKKAGITKRITPHTFRHTFATLLLEEDVDIKYIQNLLGHSSINTTQIYTHVNSVKQKKILSTKHPRRKMSFKPEDKN